MTLALTAVMIAAVLSMLALGIDLGMLFTAHGEAQRAADSAALAGAAMFLDPTTSTVAQATAQAKRLASANTIRNAPIDTSTVVVQVNLSAREVYVRVQRADMRLWFARLLGINFGSVKAAATARASDASQTNCLAPLAIPDWWEDVDNDTNNHLIWDSNENWVFGSNAGDRYEKLLPGGSNALTATGLGSPFRNANTVPGRFTNDQGRTMIMKAQNPKQTISSGFFYPIRLNNSQGAQDYKDNWLGCATASLGAPIDLEMGAMVGPTNQIVSQIMNMDPGIRWDQSLNGGAGGVTGSSYGAAWASSPRVLLIGLFNPNQIATIQGNANVNGPHNIILNDFGLFLLEGFDPNAGPGPQPPVMGRFLQYANGSAVNPNGQAGALVRVLQLIK